ncbi:MAG: type II toxin-antitoxin system VapC family toxin [Gemmatimonadales bacterium]|nr:type II toxin-antitoxin system VapC family toxin [Gemmatimonadales bacterium]
MIVADANVIAYLVMPGARTQEVEAVLSRDAMWAAPTLWRSELRSVVHKYVVRGDITISRALAVLEQADDVIDGREGQVESRVVLEFATRSKCSTYDCEYVALAEALGVPLITVDRAVLRAFPGTAMTPAAFLGS